MVLLSVLRLLLFAKRASLCIFLRTSMYYFWHDLQVSLPRMIRKCFVTVPALPKTEEHESFVKTVLKKTVTKDFYSIESLDGNAFCALLELPV
jgi:hypothetical protein